MTFKEGLKEWHLFSLKQRWGGIIIAFKYGKDHYREECNKLFSLGRIRNNGPKEHKRRSRC